MACFFVDVGCVMAIFTSLLSALADTLGIFFPAFPREIEAAYWS